MSKRLRDKTDKAIQAHAVNMASGRHEVKPGASARALRTYMIDLPTQARHERDALVSEVSRFEGALPVRSLDPALIAHSTWGNRHASSFDCAEYFALKQEIQSSGGNVQPIKVRPIPAAVGAQLLPGSTGSSKGTPCYEVVFGHRRHRACLELGFPVLALIEELSDAELFAQMERENRNREPLSPWEQGVMYLKALEAGLFTSMRQLAVALGCDAGTVSRAISLAQLPDEVVRAFRSPTDLQFRWAKPLVDAIQKDRKAVLRRAERVIAKSRGLSPASTFDALVGAHAEPVSTPEYGLATLCHAGKRIGEVVRDSRQRTVVRFHRPLTMPEHSAMVHAIQKAFQKL